MNKYEKLLRVYVFQYCVFFIQRIHVCDANIGTPKALLEIFQTQKYSRNLQNPLPPPPPYHPKKKKKKKNNKELAQKIANTEK